MSKKSAGHWVKSLLKIFLSEPTGNSFFASTLPKMVEISGKNGRLLQNSYFS